MGGEQDLRARVIVVAGRIEKANDFCIGKSFDLLSPDQGRIAAVVDHLFGEPLKQFVLRRRVRQKISRSLDLDGPGFLQLPPERDSRGFVRGRQAEEKQQPGMTWGGSVLFHAGG